MKKLIIVCTIIVMALAMTMPCFASETEFVQFEWSTEQVKKILAELGTEQVEENFTFTANGEEFVKLVFDGNTTNVFDVVMYFRADGTSVVAYRGSSGWVSGYQRIITDRATAEVNDGLLGRMLPLNFVDSSSIVSVYDKFKEQITVENIVAVLVVGATAIVGLVFMWWGVRKLTRAVFVAFRKGKIPA